MRVTLSHSGRFSRRHPCRIPLAQRWAICSAVVVLSLTIQPPGGWADETVELPGVSSVPRGIEPEWLEAVRLEYAGQYREAGQAYEDMFAKDPERVEAAWRAARTFWQFGEEFTADEFAEGESWFERADALAAKGLQADPQCGECALWKYAAMGRLVEHRGSLWAARHASDLRDLLEIGIAAQPSHRDPDGNSSLANLYYSSAIFYRMVPEWFWLPIVAGVKGDTERALADIKQALAISGDRIDYHIEHGAVLLCRAKRNGDEAARESGVRILEQAVSMTPIQRSDVVDQHYAALLIADPSGACGFTRQGFLDVESMAGSAGFGR